MQDYEYHLDVFGQHTAQIYTQICLCFPFSATSHHEDIIITLNDGLHRLATALPWTFGKVIKDNEGVFTVQMRKTRPQIVVKDLSPSIAMRSLRQSDFPITSLDEDLLCPVRTQPQPDSLDVWPVFVVQATFVKEGLLLTCTLQHQVGDMTALAQVMYLLNKACCDEEFTQEELNIGNVDRRAVVSLLERLVSNEQGTGSDSPVFPSTKPQSQPQKESPSAATSPTKLGWANIAFSTASLIALKAEAMNDVPPGSYVSTDDALSAFIWRHMTLAKLSRLESEEYTTFGRTVDMRKHIGFPLAYAGVAATKASVTESAHALATHKSLGTIASALRAAVNTPTLGHDFRMLATMRARPQSRDESPTSDLRLDPTKDVMLSSWAKYTEIWSFDFGLGLGKPVSVRRPLFRPAKEGLVYLLPKRPNGEIVAVLCLREEDLRWLKEDKEWVRWAMWIG